MKKNIKFILLFCLFVFGLITANNTWMKKSIAEVNNSVEMVSDNMESVHSSFISKASDLNNIQHSYYDETEDASAFDISNAILSQNNLYNGLSTPKVLKNFAMRSTRLCDSEVSLDKNISDTSINLAANCSYRYFVYTLRHILI